MAEMDTNIDAVGNYLESVISDNDSFWEELRTLHPTLLTEELSQGIIARHSRYQSLRARAQAR